MSTPLKLVKTCSACPEQYDVFIKEEKVGYLRLRHGYFTAKYIPTGDIVYESHTNGDGVFMASERSRHLNAAIQALVYIHGRND